MSIVEKYYNDALYYQFKRINDISFINHLFTSRIGWKSEIIRSNISDIFNVSVNNIVGIRQVHGTNIKIIDSTSKKNGQIVEEADGLITNLPDIVLTTYHADCVPIYFVDKVKKIVGVAHGGWRGTFENISGKMIDVLKDKFNSNCKDILVAIGPSIGSCCYEVGQNIGEKFIQKYNRFANILINKNNRLFLDLWKINYYQIREKGVFKDSIILSEFCTSCKIEKFYSYRKEKGTDNRMIAAIGLTSCSD